MSLAFKANKKASWAQILGNAILYYSGEGITHVHRGQCFETRGKMPKRVTNLDISEPRLQDGELKLRPSLTDARGRSPLVRIFYLKT